MSSLQLTDLELTIAPLGDGLGISLRLQNPDFSRGPFPIALDLTTLLQHANDIETYGAALRDMLFADPQVREAFLACRAAGLGAGKLLRVRLLLPAALQRLRWEALIDPHSGRGLARDGSLLLSRYLSGDDITPLHLRPRGQVKVLLAVAAPCDAHDYDLAPIDAEAETQAVIAAFDTDIQTTPPRSRLPEQGTGGEGQVATIVANWEQLGDALRAGCDILYLVAHGALRKGQPWLYLVDDQGNVDIRRGGSLADLLRSLDGARRPRLVVLSSCASAGDGYADALAALGPLLAQAGVPAVLAMQGNLSIGTNKRFAPVFFRELLHDGLIDRAVNSARLAVDDRPDWWMPVLYTRLRDGQLWEDQLTSAAPAVSPSYGTLPPEPTLIIGREAQLQQLKIRLGLGASGSPAPRAVTAIHGFPGQGKTTLALALAYNDEIRQAFPGGVLWADLGESPQIDLQRELARWGEALGDPRVGAAPDLAETIRRTRALLQGRRMLLIVDDIWQKEHGAEFARVRGDCPLIVTTRAAAIAAFLTDTADDRIRLPGLDLEAGMALLSRLAPQVVARYPAACRALVTAVEGLPLALQVAGRLLHEDEASQLYDIPTRIAELTEGQLLDEQLPAQIAHMVRETNSPTVAALLRRSIDYLDSETRERFVLLGLFDAKPATFDLTVIADAWGVDRPEPTIRRLLDRGLLEPAASVSGVPRFQMHALLADLASAMLGD